MLHICASRLLGTQRNLVFSHHQQALVGIDDAQPNGHVGVLTVLQEGTDGDVSALGVRLVTHKHMNRKRIECKSRKKKSTYAN